VLLALGLLAATGLLAPPVSATWQSSRSAGPQTVSAGTLAPPTGTDACVLLLPATQVRVTWTATPSTFADGYEVFRSATDGGPYTSVGTVGGQATTTFTDTTATVLTTYYFVVQSTRHLWRSVDSTQAAATVPLSLCTG
jgi:hypothetical protein